MLLTVAKIYFSIDLAIYMDMLIYLVQISFQYLSVRNYWM